MSISQRSLMFCNVNKRTKVLRLSCSPEHQTSLNTLQVCTSHDAATRCDREEREREAGSAVRRRCSETARLDQKDLRGKPPLSRRHKKLTRRQGGRTERGVLDEINPPTKTQLVTFGRFGFDFISFLSQTTSRKGFYFMIKCPTICNMSGCQSLFKTRQKSVF